ncbi:MAG: hypothetical protein WKF59_14340 [Chitinophagaceae bacterium]
MIKKNFPILEVKELINRQISEYVEKWYSIEEINVKVRKHETKDCLEQLKNVDSQLKHNPLLLSLILILYRNEQDLPTSKLEIYEGCAQTLIETRDKKEKIRFRIKNLIQSIGIFKSCLLAVYKRIKEDEYKN